MHFFGKQLLVVIFAGISVSAASIIDFETTLDIFETCTVHVIQNSVKKQVHTENIFFKCWRFWHIFNGFSFL